jgi:hypothetical protein
MLLVVVGLGVFSVVISFISLYKSLMIEMYLILCVFYLIGVPIQHTLDSYDHYFHLDYEFFVESLVFASHNNLPSCISQMNMKICKVHGSQDIFSLMYMPKNFVLVLYGMCVPWNITCGNNGFLFCVVWKDIANVFWYWYLFSICVVTSCNNRFVNFIQLKYSLIKCQQ